MKKMKPIYNVVEMTMAAGENSVEKRVNIDRGERVYVTALAKPAPDQIFKLGLYENSTEIHPKMDISHYKGGIGTFEQRAVQLAYQGGSEITVRASLKNNVAADVEIEAVFLTYAETSC